MLAKKTNPRRKPARNLGISEDNLWPLETRPRKIYVAASLDDQAAAARFALNLQDLGFEVVSRWIRKDFSGMPGRYADRREWSLLMEEMGAVDLEDLGKADTLVVLAKVPSSTGGFHCELGYFLGAGKSNVVVVGDRPNVFFWTEHVRWTSSAEELAKWLASEEHGKVGPAPSNSNSNNFFPTYEDMVNDNS